MLNSEKLSENIRFESEGKTMKIKTYRGYLISKKDKLYCIEFCDTILKFKSLDETIMFIDDVLPCD